MNRSTDIVVDASMTASGPILVFDGTCVLCNGWVQFLLRHDRHARFRFAAMQTGTGRRLLLQHGLDPDDPVSLLVLDGGQALTDTDAVLRVLARLGGVWHLLAWLGRGVPRPLRDPVYRWVARNRYRWFGRHAACAVPSPQQRDRFIVD